MCVCFTDAEVVSIERKLIYKYKSMHASAGIHKCHLRCVKIEFEEHITELLDGKFPPARHVHLLKHGSKTALPET